MGCHEYPVFSAVQAEPYEKLQKLLIEQRRILSYEKK